MESKTAVNYVLGFMFSENKAQVALIRKQRPVWQRGKLNGMGGHIEKGESAVDAMVREFKEETGMETVPSEWHHYATLSGDGFNVVCFTALGDVATLKSTTDESIQLVQVFFFYPGKQDYIENVPWLVGIACDFLADGRPLFATIKYQ